MSTLRRTLAVARVVGAVALWQSGAWAQRPSSPSATAPLTESLQGPARQAYDSAKLLAANRDFVSALTEFRHSYQLSKDARLLFNMAICEKELRHYGRMESLLEQYLREGSADTISPQSRATAQDAIAAARPLVATLRLSTKEPGATVVVDGEAVGTTPLAGPLRVDLGKHTVAVKKEGFDGAEQTLETPGGSDTTLTLALVATKRTAQLVVVAEGDAIVEVDDRPVGQGRFDGVLSAGSHDVRVTANSKRPYQTQLELRNGETRTLEVTLEEEHKRPVWPWIVGAATVAVGAVVGGYFLFKPEDHGAPLTGTLTTVQANAVWVH